MAEFRTIASVMNEQDGANLDEVRVSLNFVLFCALSQPFHNTMVVFQIAAQASNQCGQ